MNDKQACPSVLPLYRMDSGTKEKQMDKHRDKNGTYSLKALAWAVSSVPADRGGRDKGRDKAKKLVPEGIGQLGRQLPSSQLSEEKENLLLSPEKCEAVRLSVAGRQHPTPSDQAGGWSLVLDLENGRAWYEPLDDENPAKRQYVRWPR